MRVHVTGVAGLIGSHLARHWLNAGATVAGNDHLQSGYLDNIDRRCKFYAVDCTDLDEMVRVTAGADIVYHCAATPHEGLSVFSPTTITDSVFGSTVTVTTACIINKVKRLITCSSMARYGAIETPFTEDMHPMPEDPYGVAKLAAEKEVELLCRVHGLEYVIAVPHNVVGVGQRYDDPYRNVVAIMINRCLQGKPPIIYGDGSQERCFSDIDDALPCLVKMATESVVGEVINIGPDEHLMTINRLAELVMRETDFKGEAVHVPPRPQEVKVATCSANKARRLLGYATTIALETTVKRMVEWIKHRGPLEFDYYLPLEIVNEKTPKTWLEKKI